MTGIPTLVLAFPHAATIFAGMLLALIVCAAALWRERERSVGATVPAMGRLGTPHRRRASAARCVIASDGRYGRAVRLRHPAPSIQSEEG